jgi:hypothetical protein
VNPLARFRLLVRIAFAILVLGFALMFVSPSLGAWVALPGMVVVVACGLLAFGVQFLALFSRRRTHG